MKKIFLMLALLCAIVQGMKAQSGIYCTASDVGRVICTDGSIYDNVSAATAAGRTAVAKVIWIDETNKKGLALSLQDDGQTSNIGTANSICNGKNNSLPVDGATWKLASKDEWDKMIAGNPGALRDGFSSVGGQNMKSELYYSSTNYEYSSAYTYAYDFGENQWETDKNGIFSVICNVRACLEFNLLELYTIGSASDWNEFCIAVNLGHTFSDKYVKLTSNISVSTMAGYSETNSFQGAFDGDGKTLTFNKSDFTENYCAPFRYVGGTATIKNLRTAGTINTTYQYAGGMVAWIVDGSNVSIKNCRSAVTINSSNHTNGGFVSRLGDNANTKLTISGCAFDGSFEGTGHHNGGFVGYCEVGSSATFTDCLFAPDHISCDLTECRTFSRGVDATITNCYYTQTLGTAQGTAVVAYTNVPIGLGALVKDYGMVKAYAGGILFDGKYYSAASSITGSGTENAPYIISSVDSWNEFAQLVNNGINNFNSKFVKLTADISVSVMVGASESNSFQGTFLGDGVHTLTFTQGTSGSAFGEESCAPFRYTKGATIKDLKVAGDIYTSQKLAAGLASRPYGTTTITNCHVSTVIHSSKNGDCAHGGIVAMPSGSLSIEGCAYTGRLLTNNGSNNCAGFVGWSGDNTFTIMSSLYAPSGSIPEGWSAINAGATFVRGNKPITATTCYYTETMGTAQGKLASTFTTAPSFLGSLVQDYGLMIAYQNGVFFNGTYYVARALNGAGTVDNPYTIATDYDWETFVYYVNNGFNNYNNEFVRLNANISVSDMVGTSSQMFQGTFLGNGKMLTFTKGSSESAFNEQYCAPFRYTNGATITNLKVAGEIYTAQKFAAGLIARPNGTTTITDCLVSTVIHSSVVNSDSNDGTHAGFIAYPQGNADFSGCLYDGRLFTTNGTTKCGGFVGWHNGKTFSFTNSLYAPNPSITAAANEEAITADCATFVRGGTVSTGCYYTEAMGDAQGTQIYTAAPAGEISTSKTINNTTYYAVSTVSGVSASYTLNNGVPSITPTVTDAFTGSNLTFGTDFTATLDGNDVASLPIALSTMGSHTLVISAAGSYIGSKTFSITVTGDLVTFTDADSYTRTEDANVTSATYTKTTDRVGKFHSWLVPFDYTITAADLQNFTFYKINMIANAPNPQTNASDEMWVFLKQIGEGDVLHANMPYVYKPLKAVTDYAFTTNNAVLKAKNTGVIADASTLEDIYSFYATYEPTTATAQDPFYYVNIDGGISLGNDGTVSVGAFRWIIRVESKFGGSTAYARKMTFFDGESDVTGIRSIDNGQLIMDNSWYTLDGRKLDGKPAAKGIYMNGGKKVVIK